MPEGLLYRQGGGLGGASGGTRRGKHGAGKHGAGKHGAAHGSTRDAWSREAALSLFVSPADEGAPDGCEDHVWTRSEAQKMPAWLEHEVRGACGGLTRRRGTAPIAFALYSLPLPP